MTLICGLYGDKLESIDIRNNPKNTPPDVKGPQSGAVQFSDTTTCVIIRILQTYV